MTPPQSRLLAAVGRYGCLSAFQLTRLLYGEALAWVRPQLNKLVAQQLLRIRPFRRFPDKKGGKPLDIYVLTTRGRSYLKKLGISPTYMPALKEQYPLKHALASNDLVILAHRLARTPPYKVEDFRVEFDLKQQPVTVGRYNLVPDAYTYISTEETEAPIVWELDRSTEGKRMVQRKVDALARCVNGAYRELFSVDSITVAFVADTEKRMHQLLGWTEQTLESIHAEVLGPNFLFASFDTSKIEAHDVFLTPIWQQPFSSEPICLIP